MVCDFAGMKLADDGSSGALDKSKINFLQISVNGFTGAVDFWIDDLEFYSEELGAEGVAYTSDFSGETSNKEVWSGGTYENGKMTVTGPQFQLKDSRYINYQNTYAIRLKVKTENVASINVRLLNGGKGINTTVSVAEDGEYEYVLYYNQMTERGGAYTSMKWDNIYFYITFGSGGGSVEFTSVELLIG